MGGQLTKNTQALRIILPLLAVTCLLTLLVTSCGDSSDEYAEYQARLREHDRQTLTDYIGRVEEYQQRVRAAMSGLRRALRQSPERMILPYREELATVVMSTHDELFSAENGLDLMDPGTLSSLEASSSENTLHYAHKELRRSARKRTKMMSRLLDVVSWTPRKSQWDLFPVSVASEAAAGAYDAFWEDFTETADALDVPIPFSPLPDYRWFGDPSDYSVY
jgi:hypothetical protein